MILLRRCSNFVSLWLLWMMVLAGSHGETKIKLRPEDVLGLGNGNDDALRQREELKEEISLAKTAQPFDDWKEKYNGDPYKVMADPRFKELKESKMFFRLFGYILGANDRNEKIPMTKPVTGRWKPDRTNVKVARVQLPHFPPK